MPSNWTSVPAGAYFPNNGNGGLTYDAVINGGTVFVNRAIDIEDLKLTSGILAGAMNLTLRGVDSTWTGGNMEGTGSTSVADGATINFSGGGDPVLDGRTLQNMGTATFTGNNYLHGKNGALFINESSGLVDLQGTNHFRMDGGAVPKVSNAGTFRKSVSASAIDFAFDFDNTGALEVQSGTLQLLKTFNNSGTVNVNAGSLVLKGGGTQTGAINVAAGARIEFSSNASTHTKDSVVTGAGTIQFAGGTHNFAGRIQDVGLLAITSGRVAMSDSVSATPSIRELLLSGSGTLDLGPNDLVVQADAQTREPVLRQIVSWIKTARGAGKPLWKGYGVTSSTAADDPQQLTSLGIALNQKPDGGGLLYPALFSGVPVDGNSILVKYTWNGDANIDGVVNADDYFQIDQGYITQRGGWYNGDFNYDGVVNADDYFLIDSAFIAQTGPLAATSGGPSAVPEPAALALLAAGLLLLPGRRFTARPRS